MKSVAVIGQGFVGGSLTTVMSERGLEVYVYDKTGKVALGGKQPEVTIYDRGEGTVGVGVTYPQSVKQFVETMEGTLARDKKPTYSTFLGIYFVCLPTPMYEDGSADLSIVEGVLKEISEVQGNRIAVIKSTVPPGSVAKWNSMFERTGLQIVHCPEFLRESSALDDMRNQTRIIVGGPKSAVKKVRQLFTSTFPDVKFIATSSTNSELTKYVTNCFLAMKISFANELYQIVEKLTSAGLDVDYNRIIECATLDSRLGTSHWQVPSFETGENGQQLRGFSLSCFPKDVNALICKAKELGVEPTMLEATWRKNVEVRPGKDWEKMVGRAVSKKSK